VGGIVVWSLDEETETPALSLICRIIVTETILIIQDIHYVTLRKASMSADLV
jgi:hypothetical protein